MPEQKLKTGVTLHVEDVGTGQALVLIHGWSMSGRFFQRQVPTLSRTHRVVVPDLRGHGRSEKVLNGHTVATYASDLHELFTVRDVSRPVLVGWSMGAMVAYEYLKQFGQEDVAGIIIVEQEPSDFAWDGYEFGGFTLRALDEMNQQIQTDQRGLAQGFAELMVHDSRCRRRSPAPSCSTSRSATTDPSFPRSGYRPWCCSVLTPSSRTPPPANTSRVRCRRRAFTCSRSRATVRSTRRPTPSTSRSWRSQRK
jgi:pimeloyl-ACP methyl ester carboxylesterase